MIRLFPLIFVLLWSSAFITTKPIVDYSDPFAALAFRFSIVAFGFFLFSVFFLYQKHDVTNDSTISEWLINYEGGFTKRGFIGQLSIYLSNLFVIKLRDSIFLFQAVLIGTYFFLIFHFLKNIFW